VVEFRCKIESGLPPARRRIPERCDSGTIENPRSTRHSENGDRQTKPDPEVAMCPSLPVSSSSPPKTCWFVCRSSRRISLVQVTRNGRFVDPAERSRMIQNDQSNVAGFPPKYLNCKYLQNAPLCVRCWCTTEARLSLWTDAINTPARKGFTERGMLCRLGSISNRLPGSSSCGLKTACRTHGR